MAAGGLEFSVAHLPGSLPHGGGWPRALPQLPVSFDVPGWMWLPIVLGSLVLVWAVLCRGSPRGRFGWATRPGSVPQGIPGTAVDRLPAVAGTRRGRPEIETVARNRTVRQIGVFVLVGTSIAVLASGLPTVYGQAPGADGFPSSPLVGADTDELADGDRTSGARGTRHPGPSEPVDRPATVSRLRPPATDNWLGYSADRDSPDPAPRESNRPRRTDTAPAGDEATVTNVDTDGDGLQDGRERELGTDPTQADTDSDGLTDQAEVAGETDPTRRDTDGDGLSDGHEAAIGTNGTNRDTDADGLADGSEVTASNRLPGADPLRKDVFVELDVHTECTVEREQLDRVRQAFADAPVDNPGEQGIAVHFVISDRIDEYDFVNDSDHFGQGYFYAALVPTIDGGYRGLAREFTVAVQCEDTLEEQGAIMMHELGHLLGLVPDVTDGIDSRRYPFKQYPSAMNYNRPLGVYDYSTGDRGPDDFDDWGYIESHMRTPHTTPLST